MSRIFIAAVIIFFKGRGFFSTPGQTLSSPVLQQFREIINQAAGYRHNKQRGCCHASRNSYTPGAREVPPAPWHLRHRKNTGNRFAKPVTL
jgi:hypothetical protein